MFVRLHWRDDVHGADASHGAGRCGPSSRMEMTILTINMAMVEHIGTTRTTTRVVTIISTKMHAREDTRTLRRKTHDGMRAVPGSK